MLFQKLIFATLFFFYVSHIQGQSRRIMGNDTSIVVKVIDCDSIVVRNNIEHMGYKYYYGVHHFKVGLIDIQNNNKVIDTIIVAYVYNRFKDINDYKANFKIIKGKAYLFYVHKFKPCVSDFPRIQGYCDENDNTFYPESNKLIKKYDEIFRIITVFPFSFNKQ